ncbi:hypothetical protein, partial [Bradyrhizobium sp. Leo170]|uniref:hypothetical protein n=1 Tax=Bradyrhizobium sp. Leo170 TaxID=1571199 RepID=UPI0010E1F98B
SPTTTEIANWFIAMCAAPSTGRKAADPIETVKFARAALRITDRYLPPGYVESVEGLTFPKAETFGEAIDLLIEDMRAGAYAEWKGDHYPTAKIQFFDHGSRIFMQFQRASGDARSFLLFRNEDGHFGGPCLTHCVEVDCFALERIAEAMGAPVPAPA